MSRMNLEVFTNNLYQAISDDDSPREMNSWHASSIAKCPREQYLMRKGQLPFQKPGAGKVLRWKAGHLIEEVIRPYLKQQMPNLVSNERLTSKQLGLTGEYDNYDPDSKTIWEIKSVSSHAVRYRRKDETRHHLRDDQQYLVHEWQEHAYVLLMREQHIEVDQIGYLYITLDGLLIPYITPVQEGLLNAVSGRLAELNHAWATQEPPACICGDESNPLYKSSLQFCQYKTDWSCCEVTQRVL